jgi:hypothetical protein
MKQNWLMKSLMGEKKNLAVCISLDVEEEGLFSGSYQAWNCSVTNVQRLRKLEPLCRELGFPLTLLCTHSVFDNPEARKTLEYMRDTCGAEIGAHLHHWSTPPYDKSSLQSPPLRSGVLSRDTLRKRLEVLLNAGRDFQGAPLECFRMGRWDLLASWRPMLSESGILIDSSICPLRHFAGGPNHFSAPSDPYWVRGKDKLLLEAPITQIPLNGAIAKMWDSLCGKNQYLRDRFHFFGAASANPFWHGPGIMRLATRLHSMRGGKVLSIFWHSSEMLPGASPHTPDEEAANTFLEKIFKFGRWLNENYNVKAITMRELYQMAPDFSFDDYAEDSDNRDW